MNIKTILTVDFKVIGIFCFLLLTLSSNLQADRPTGIDFAIWTGASTAGNSWDDPENWDIFAVPFRTDDVFIPNTGNDPFIPATSSVEVEDLTVEPGATLTFGFDRNVNGGTSASLKVNGNLVNDGVIDMLSSASLVLLGTRSGSGYTLMSRTLEGSGALQIIGSPLEGITVGDLNADFVYVYNNLTQQYEVPAANTVMEPGKGYFVGDKESNFFFFNRNRTDNTIAHGDIDVAVTDNTDGFNLIANPYPTAIDVSAFFSNTNNSTVTTGTAYLWNDGGTNSGILRGGDYVTVNSMGTATGRFDPGTGVVGQQDPNTFDGAFNSFQGFYVEANQNGVVSFTPDMQVTGDNDTNSFFRESSEPTDGRSILKLSLKGNNHYNEIIIGQDHQATFDDDYSMDAKKLDGSGKLSFYAMHDDAQYSILAIPFVDSKNIDLGFEVSETGEYELSVKELGLAENVTTYFLIDQLTGERVELQPDTVLKFSLNQGVDNSRFSIEISGKSSGSENQLNASIGIEKVNDLLTLNHSGNVEKVLISDLQGRVLFNQVVDFSNGQSTLNVSLKDGVVYLLQVGNYRSKFLWD